ncbi:hypothetical protein P20652_3078 [Pseudoalteromonas sp. BSi20652]|uniref:VpsP family polysaccharide biosynthesis protein n=1 Tax=Pseudoalteromonas sp. BSi20652 TaxID=388384 RepID=UPI0002318BFB|nr:VpsP family polysaccharide biosynthesis protein [Pseudoalteromonas sp. BSi20652]GAA61201.1 hypothetical protein P20652_3078 [Pseudoalteromonas sp. BSi20652]
MNNTNKLIKQVQIVVLVLITLAICFSSFQSMRANTWYFNAVNTLNGSANNYSPQNLQSAQDAINLASSLEPTHPHYLQLMAHVQILKLAADTDKTTDVLAIYQQVEQLLLQSVALRQSWPETWIALAQVVSYQEGPSERVYEYIQQGKKVGPYKFDVQLGIIQIALMNWQQLPPKYKALYVNELKLAAKHGNKFSRAFDIAKQVDALPILCLSLKFGAHFEPVRTSWMFKKHCN